MTARAPIWVYSAAALAALLLSAGGVWADPPETHAALNAARAELAGLSDRLGQIVSADAAVLAARARLWHELASSDDRRVVYAWARGAASSLEAFGGVLAAAERRFREDARVWILCGSELETLQRRRLWWRARVSLHAARAARGEDLSPQRRGKILEGVASVMGRFAREAETQESVRCPALLARARALRLLGRWDQAGRILAAEDPPADEATRRDWLFERALVAIDGLPASGADAARRAVEDYRDAGAPLAGTPLGRLYAARLEHRRLRVLAAERAEESQRIQALRAADEALLALLNPSAGAENGGDDAFERASLRTLGAAFEDEPVAFCGAVILLGRARDLASRPGGAAEAAKLLETLLARKDAVARAVRGRALWLRGRMLHGLGRRIEAAESFGVLARMLADDPRAARAAHAAAATLYEAVQAADEPDDALSRACAEAIRLLLRRDARRADEAAWLLRLARVHRRLASRAATTEARLEQLRLALEGYRRAMRADGGNWQARFGEAMLSAALMSEAGGPAAPDEKDALRRCSERLFEFAREAAAAAEPAKGSSEPAALREYAVRAGIQAARLEAERLDDRERALEILAWLLDESGLAGAPSLPAARRMEVDLLLASRPARYSLAAGRIQRLLVDDPAKGPALLERLVQGLRADVRADRRAAAGGEALTEQAVRRRRLFLAAAGRLAEWARQEEVPRRRLYRIEQILAEACNAAGEHRRALELWRSCGRELSQISTSATAGEDARNLLGEARALAGIGQIEPALAIYGRLAGGLEPKTSGDMYWQVQLEHGRLLAEAFAEEPQRLEDLLTRIEQLRSRYPDLGGRAEAFDSFKQSLEGMLKLYQEKHYRNSEAEAP